MARPEPHVKHAMLTHLRSNHPSMCRHWFDDIDPVDLTGGTLSMLVREQVQLKYLQRCCTSQFTEAAQAATHRLLAVRFIGEEDGAQLLRSSRDNKRTPNGQSSGDRTSSDLLTEDDMLLSPDYTFSTFVIGPDNRLAHAAAYAVAHKPGKAYNPLFIHGGVGLGKTHLLQAICQAIMRNRTNMCIYYTSCNGFMTKFLDAVQAGLMAEFRHRFRNVDLLVVDDIHDLSKRDRTQEEFFHTFNALYQSGKQIVLSSDAAPAEIPALEERLVSRFNCGLVARIETPCYETRVAIVKTKAALRNLDLPDDVICYIASRIDTNIRELEGAVTKVQGNAMIQNKPIDLELAKAAIGEHSPHAANGPSIQVILEAVSRFYDVRLADLLSKRKHKSTAHPRQIGMWLARKHTRHSLGEIGSYFGGRHHTTVLHAIQTIDRQKAENSSFDREVGSLEEQLAHHGEPVAAIG